MKTINIFKPSMDEITQAKRKAMVHNFIPNHVYRIYSASYASNSGNTAPKLASAGIAWEKQCIFVFLRKEGKHHIFRELKGGWTRTYTDAQLIGKSVTEVLP